MSGDRDCPGRTPLRRADGLPFGGRILLQIGTVLLGLLLATSSASAKRVAFVVGINSYENLRPDLQLGKAVADARAIADTFSGLGFQVIRGENTKRNAFFQAWQRFLNTVQPGDVAAIYFAGHGVEIQNTNYILTSDIPEVEDGADVMKSSAIDVSGLLDRLKQQQPQVVLAIIDACRDNPFSSRGTRGVGGGGGLGASDPPKGTLQMMSAGKGETALDALSDHDTNPNSVYTRTLIPLLKQPGLEITEVALQVRANVTELARSVGHDQSPAFYHELSGKFYLTEPRPTPPPEVARSNSANLVPEAAQAWATISNTANVAQLQSFVGRYGDTIYGDFARDRIREINRQVVSLAPPPPPPQALPPQAPPVQTARLPTITTTPPVAHPASPPPSPVFLAAQAWAAIKESSDAAALQAFAAQYGDTIYGPLAQARVDQLKRISVASAAPEPARSLSPAPASQTAGPSALEAGQAWNNTKSTDSQAVLEHFIKQYGDTIYGPLARARLAELKGGPTAPQQEPAPVVVAASSNAFEAAQAWNNTKDTTNPVVVEHFLKVYGDSIYADQAHAKLKKLRPQP